MMFTVQDTIKLIYHFKGRTQLALAIYYTKELMFKKPFLEIHMTKDVYPNAEKEIHKSLTATQKGIYRAIDLCWMVGCSLPARPTPAEFILYCTYYLAYRKHYHNVTDSEFPLAF